MPLLQTSGNVTADGYGGGVAAVPNYIEDVFSTYLYTGNNGSQTITNNIDLSTKGGMVWIKNRQTAADHDVTDTARGARKPIFTNSTAGQDTNVDYAVNSFLTSGFTLNSSDVLVNALNQIYASWTFRKQPKFFDVVTGTADSSGNVSFSHSLGAAPGFVIIKSTTNTSNWTCYHQSLGTSYSILLNTTGAAQNQGSGFVTSTSTTFSMNIGFGAGAVGYVAYLFAHNAGGFGLTGTDNVISCGSYTTDGSGYAEVNLGYEPQFILRKSSSTTDNWFLMDNMRGLDVGGTSDAILIPNTSGAEVSGSYIDPTATGFIDPAGGAASRTYIYIAIRRGPMKVPTSGTSVFSPILQSGGGTVTTNFPVDLAISTVGGTDKEWMDRLRGGSQTYYNYLASNLTAAEATGTGAGFGFDNNTGYKDNGFWGGPNVIYWNMKRAPSFFDEVCYTGTGSAMTIPHNLGVAPEFIIAKDRSPGGQNWVVYHSALGPTKGIFLNLTNAVGTSVAYWNNTAPTSTNVYNYGWDWNGGSGYTYVMYLFATCAGVSKVGSYTGNGTTQTIDCGFTGGARFVLIKRTDSTGDWYVYDTARGMTTLTDPYLLLNSTAAESVTLGSVTTVSTGFAVNASILAAINTNGASYIFLAIA